MPLLGKAARGLQSLFIYRGTDPTAREQVVEQIMERQRLIEEENAPYNPVCIFAEGTTSNGSSLLKFKRGGFAALRTVVPVFARVNKLTYFHPTWEVLEFWPLLIMLLSSLSCYNLELTIMPEFTPTEWML